MEKSVEIKELKLQLGKKEIVLSIQEARKLKAALEDIFGKDIIKEQIHHEHFRDFYPYHWYYDSTPWVEDTKYTQILCQNTDNQSTLMFDNSTAELRIEC